ncbi:hypothetical protein DPMN_094546 [Dreissena polymorpha]|uniref:Uncharacterized protein n=1 Tax=Dreissena polymorpha TaxID=45954 RepID=A0A9D4L5P1_DREPO|nr:hypothetical protein DPMN_094546 [Dreissena polymorpha]
MFFLDVQYQALKTTHMPYRTTTTKSWSIEPSLSPRTLPSGTTDASCTRKAPPPMTTTATPSTSQRRNVTNGFTISPSFSRR